MDEIEKLLVTIFGGILTLAVISVIISRKSQAPQAIQAFSTGLASVVKAAVNPVSTAATNGNNGDSAFTNPNPITLGNGLLNSLNVGLSTIGIPGFGGN